MWFFVGSAGMVTAALLWERFGLVRGAEPDRMPCVGERFRLWRGYATVLAVRGGEVKLRIEEGDRVLALLTVPAAAWGEVSAAWIPLGAE